MHTSGSDSDDQATQDNKPEIWDTHAHLTFPDLSSDLTGILERCREAGVTRIITIGTDQESSERALALSREREMVHCAVGWHPSDVDEAPEDVRPGLRPLLSDPKVAAIGEIGLDYYRLPSGRGGTEEQDQTVKERQKTAFAQQLDLAVESGLNCVIHQRSSFEDTWEMVEPYTDRLRFVFHCFTDPISHMKRIVEAGSLVSFTGIATFKNAEAVRDAIRATPLESLMVETDSPFLAPVPFRGKRCEPAYTRYTAEAVADLKGVTLEELGRVAKNTAREFFRGL